MDTVIKYYSNKRFGVELSQHSENVYVVRYENLHTGHSQYSENISDYYTASFLFDLKIEELEGN